MAYIEQMETTNNPGPDSVAAEAAKLNSRGIGQTGAEQYDKAIESFTQALVLQPDNAGFLFNRAEAYRRAGQNGRAKTDLEAALAKEGDTAELLLALGLVAYEDDDYDAASDWYRKAVSMKTGFAEAWNNLGVVEFRRGSYREARENFEKAVSLDKNYAEAWFNLADTCDELGLVQQRKRAQDELARLEARSDDSDNGDDDNDEYGLASRGENPELRKPASGKPAHGKPSDAGSREKPRR